MVTVALVGLMDNSQVKIKDVIKIFNVIAENDTNVTEISSTNKKYINKGPILWAPYRDPFVDLSKISSPQHILSSLPFAQSGSFFGIL